MPYHMVLGRCEPPAPPHGIHLWTRSGVENIGVFEGGPRVAKDLLAMKVTKLKEELEARGEGPRASLATRRGCGGGCTRRSSARAS